MSIVKYTWCYRIQIYSKHANNTASVHGTGYGHWLPKWHTKIIVVTTMTSWNVNCVSVCEKENRINNQYFIQSSFETGLYASFLKGQGHQGNDQWAWRQLPFVFASASGLGSISQRVRTKFRTSTRRYKKRMASPKLGLVTRPNSR